MGNPGCQSTGRRKGFRTACTLLGGPAVRNVRVERDKTVVRQSVTTDFQNASVRPPALDGPHAGSQLKHRHPARRLDIRIYIPKFAGYCLGVQDVLHREAYAQDMLRHPGKLWKMRVPGQEAHLRIDHHDSVAHAGQRRFELLGLRALPLFGSLQCQVRLSESGLLAQHRCVVNSRSTFHPERPHDHSKNQKRTRRRESDSGALPFQCRCQNIPWLGANQNPQPVARNSGKRHDPVGMIERSGPPPNSAIRVGHPVKDWRPCNAEGPTKKTDIPQATHRAIVIDNDQQTMRTKIEPVRKGFENGCIKRGDDHASEGPIRGVQPSSDIDLPEMGLQPANKRADEHTLFITGKQKLHAGSSPC